MTCRLMLRDFSSLLISHLPVLSTTLKAMVNILSVSRCENCLLKIYLQFRQACSLELRVLNSLLSCYLLFQFTKLRRGLILSILAQFAVVYLKSTTNFKRHAFGIMWFQLVIYRFNNVKIPSVSVKYKRFLFQRHNYFCMTCRLALRGFITLWTNHLQVLSTNASDVYSKDTLNSDCPTVWR